MAGKVTVGLAENNGSLLQADCLYSCDCNACIKYGNTFTIYHFYNACKYFVKT